MRKPSMTSGAGTTRGSRAGRVVHGLVLVCVGTIFAASSPVHAQVPPPPPPGDFILPLPSLPRAESPPLPRDGSRTEGMSQLQLADPRSLEGPNSVASFVESLKGNDAAFEVVVGQGRILTLKEDITEGPDQALIAVGDPSVLEYSVVSPRQIRLTGMRVGVTDLSITTANNETHSFEVRVTADLTLLEGKLRATFPDASIKLGQIRDHVVVEGEARDGQQIAQIIQAITAYLQSVTVGQQRRIRGMQGGGGGGMGGVRNLPTLNPQPGLNPGEPVQGLETPVGGMMGEGDVLGGAGAGLMGDLMGLATPDLANPLQVQGAVATPQIINLLRVPGSQQVLLKVRVAELNRTALRQIGANFLGVDPDTGAIVGSQIAGPVTATGSILGEPGPIGLPGRSLIGEVSETAAATTTVFGIFQDDNFMFTLSALRRNGFLRILAEPNLVALNGQRASFLAGGEFPVPVPQVGAGGIAPTITVQFKEFGVRLGFVPHILDGDRIRLFVAPEVSNIDFAIATTLVIGGSPVPGLNTRKAETTVEMLEGQTLAIAGLLQLSLDGTTNRIPGLGDLPILGPLFSNNTGQRVEKELVVLVTPYLVEPMNADQVAPTPGDEVKEPNDLEFYFLGRIEGRTGRDFRSTTAWDPLHLRDHLNLERKYIQGPVGFSE